ncbi:MAG: CHASE4 domain-containing protein, partial [Armatimonadota bacterium]
MVTLVNRTIVDQINNLNVITKDWACTDDTYYYIFNHNRKFVKDNFSDIKLKNIQIDYICCMDNKNRVIYSKFTGSDDKNTRDTPLILPHEIFSSNDSIDKGLTFYGNKPLLIVSHPVYRSDHTGSSNGKLIMGRFLYDYEFRNISALTGHKISIYINNSSRLADGIWVSLDLIENLECMVVPIDGGHLNGYGAVYTNGNIPVPIFKLTMPRNIYGQGILSMRYLLLSLGFVALLFLIFTVWMIEGTILSRLFAINTGVKRIGSTGNISSRLYIAGKDELTDLTHEINGTLDALEQSRTDLQKAHDELEQRVEERTADLVSVNDS